MKGKFKQIYEDLNRIFESLSMIDDKGICRCVCPLDKVTGTTNGETVDHNTTDSPLDLTTFALQNNTIERSNHGEKTKQSKKYLISRNKPRDDKLNDKLKNITDVETATENDENAFMSTQEYTTLEETITTTETKEDMSPAMSNSVTNLINFKNNAQTEVPQLETLFSEVVTSDYDQDVRIIKSEAPELSSTWMTPDLNEITDMTVSTEKEEISDKNVHNTIPYYISETPDFDENNVTENSLELTTSSKNISDSIKNFTLKTLKLTSASGSYLESTTELFSTVDENNSDTRVTDEISELTSENGNILTLTTEISNIASDENTGNTRVTGGISKITSENGNILQSTMTTTSIFGKNVNNTVNIKERTTSNDRDKSYRNEKFNDNGMTNRPRESKTNDSKSQNDSESTRHPEMVQKEVQMKWYPMCFYPVPCPSNVLNYHQNGQNSDKNTVQYSAQSLSTYKKKSPLADAMIIQNNYPIISYCPMGMVCPMTDFAGQANVLHCMMNPALPDLSVNINKNNDYTLKQNMTNNDYNADTKTQITAKSKSSARESDEILTGKNTNI